MEVPPVDLSAFGAAESCFRFRQGGVLASQTKVDQRFDCMWRCDCTNPVDFVLEALCLTCWTI